jgi:hypothetical protein
MAKRTWILKDFMVNKIVKLLDVMGLSVDLKDVKQHLDKKEMEEIMEWANATEKKKKDPKVKVPKKPSAMGKVEKREGADSKHPR